MILICTPCKGGVEPGYCFDLVNLMAYSAQQGIDAAYANLPSVTFLSNGRQTLVTGALSSGASHVLFIDSDMRFPPDALKTLLSGGHSIVGANYRERVRKHLTTASRQSMRVESAGKQGIEQVDFIGFGLCLIECNVFRMLPRPWFATPWDGEMHMTDDVFFCKLARAHKIPVWVDHDVSQTVRHVAQEELGL
jgi:hypothetical protein